MGVAEFRRLAGVDYGAPGHYLITVVTAVRLRRLGTLGASGVLLSGIGECVAEAWANVGRRRPWVSTGAFVIMPDPVHGIVSWDRVPQNRSSKIWLVVNGFKGEATRLARQRRLLRSSENLWLPSYDVRLLLGRFSVARATAYIENNPAKAWRRKQR